MNRARCKAVKVRQVCLTALVVAASTAAEALTAPAMRPPWIRLDILLAVDSPHGFDSEIAAHINRVEKSCKALGHEALHQLEFEPDRPVGSASEFAYIARTSAEFARKFPAERLGRATLKSDFHHPGLAVNNRLPVSKISALIAGDCDFRRKDGSE